LNLDALDSTSKQLELDPGLVHGSESTVHPLELSVHTGHSVAQFNAQKTSCLTTAVGALLLRHRQG